MGFNPHLLYLQPGLKKQNNGVCIIYTPLCITRFTAKSCHM